MRSKHIDEIKNKITHNAIIAFTAVIIIIVMIMMIYNSMHEGELALLNAGIENAPIINNEDLQMLGHFYSELNESFEREIDAITTGKANRNNKLNKELSHYGVYGKENATGFVNNDYENGINIKYVKSDKYRNRKGGDSNFRDIISAMAVIYEQKMDIANKNDLKELFEQIFWLSHSFQYDSTELYPCEHGCNVVNRYECTDVYDEYASSNLKHTPFTVSPHNLYEDFDPVPDIIDDEIEVDDRGNKTIRKGKYRDDFNIVYPQGQCSVHGANGAGCVLDKTKLCFHGIKEMYDEEPYDSDYYELVEVEYATEELPDFAVDLFDARDKEEEESEEEEEESIDKKAKKFLGMIVDKDKTCTNYKIVKYCKEREKLKKVNDDIKREDLRYSRIESPTDAQSDFHDSKIASLEEKKAEIEEELAEHDEECKRDNPEYLCGGFNICLGHADHYRCDKHNVVVCFGHTNINMNVKILYGEDIIEEFYKAVRGE